MKYLYTFFLGLFSCSVFADGMHISGIIKDIDTQEPVGNALVQIKFFEGFEFSGATDSTGRYEITTTAVVPEGYYGVEIDAKDYYKPNGFVHVTKECTFNFSLKSKNPKPVEAVAIKKPEPVVVPKPALEGYATNNLVFLIDISASMNAPEKMPLLKESMKYLVSELRATDKVAILTFSKTVQEVLSPTFVSDKDAMNKVIEGLSFGSTSQGGIALNVAYQTALKNFIEKGNNRIVLASDGVFTSGEKDYSKMQKTIEEGLDKNISLSVFCFGKATDYVNTKLKKLTTLGKGNYAVVTAIDEGKQYMLEEAKAVKN
ncbi:MAG TPA: VWA domain-containing protein [Chitinophagales bacterium]|nr:VWA domain-containing protein [Chitinophagales bacterium]